MATRSRATRDGLAYGVFLGALLAVSWASGNNLVYAVSATLTILSAGNLWLGRRNLVGLEVRRHLPAEIYEGQPVRGGYDITVCGGPAARFELVLDEGGIPRGRAMCPAFETPTAELRTVWTFPRRGRHLLVAVRVRSLFPFRLVQRTTVLPVVDEVWVYPRPEPGGVVVDGDGVGIVAGRGEPEQLHSLRAYRPGDRLRDVHWPTSARVGSPMVVVRERSRVAPVWVELREGPGIDREAAIRRAAGAVLEQNAAGRPVGLRADGQAWPPRTGDFWRRELLRVLATLPTASGQSRQAP